MGKFLVGVVNNVKIKMDTPDDIYYDAKDPHVSLEGPGGEIYVRHLDLYSINDTVGTGSSNVREAIYWVRKKQDKLIAMYIAKKPYRIYD